ncbi:MAG: hypothetical protein ISS57_06420 [Anaerolineales bacterium]|nr:hypothetical protein [Anaerolineales bacterium]
MQSHIYTTEEVLKSLGYPDPLVAARQQARMILLGRLSRYEAALRQLKTQWDCSLDELRARYQVKGSEDSPADDAYIEWQWYADASETVKAQLNAISES